MYYNITDHKEKHIYHRSHWNLLIVHSYYYNEKKKLITYHTENKAQLEIMVNPLTPPSYQTLIIKNTKLAL